VIPSSIEPPLRVKVPSLAGRGEMAPVVDSPGPRAAEPASPAATDAEASGAVRPERPENARNRIRLHMPVDVRSVSMAVLAVLASVFFLQWAKEVFIPLLLSIMFSYALSPAVDFLQRWHLPRALGSALLLGAILSGLVSAGASMSDDATMLIESLPDVAQKLRQSIQQPKKVQGTTIDKVQQAASEIERAADENAGATAAGRGVTRVVVEKPKFNIKDYLVTGTLGLAALAAQTVVVLFLTFFLLASGNTFRRKMVKLAGPRLSQKRITVQALDEINGQIQRYLLVQVATSLLVGVATGLAFLAIGLQHAAVWGVFAAVTNLIPYIGSVLVGGASALVGFMQFGAIDMGLAVGASSFAIHTIVGNLVTPWLTGRASRMSPLAVFVGVLAFGWLWGVWGLLLGVPILMVVKSICDRVEELKRSASCSAPDQRSWSEGWVSPLEEVSTGTCAAGTVASDSARALGVEVGPSPRASTGSPRPAPASPRASRHTISPSPATPASNTAQSIQGRRSAWRSTTSACRAASSTSVKLPSTAWPKRARSSSSCGTSVASGRAPDGAFAEPDSRA
jgi:predicted PurR-regulated permease PerM